MTTVMIGAAAVTATPSVQAEGPKPGPAPNNSVLNCTPNTKCAPVAVGDFDGNGIDDIVFQTVTLPVCTSSARSLIVRYGPFGDGLRSLRPDTRITLSPGEGLAAVSVADVSGDGRDDLGIAVAARRTGEELQRVVVLDLAAAGWPKDVVVGAATRGTYRYERIVPLRSRDSMTPSRLTLILVDVDGDSEREIVLGIDAPFPLLTASRTGCASSDMSRPPTGASSVVIDRLPRGAATVRRTAGAETARIDGLGSCIRAGLGGVADVTGDALSDIVVRRCSPPLPDAVGLVDGRSATGLIDVEGAVPPVDVEPGTIPGPPVGSGYAVALRAPVNLFDDPSPLLIRDLNGDGTADIGSRVGANTHVFSGGPALGARLLAGAADRAFVGAGFGGAALNRSWRPADMDGDGEVDLVLTVPTESTPVVGRNTRGNVTTSVLTEPLALFTDDWRTRDIVDVQLDLPIFPFPADGGTLWAMGDFNGDGVTDVIVGSPPKDQRSEYGWVAGPIMVR